MNPKTNPKSKTQRRFNYDVRKQHMEYQSKSVCRPGDLEQLKETLEMELFLSHIPDSWATIRILSHTYNGKTTEYVGIMCGHVTDRQQALVFDEIDRICRKSLSYTGELISRIRDDTLYVNLITADWKHV